MDRFRRQPLGQAWQHPHVETRSSETAAGHRPPAIASQSAAAEVAAAISQKQPLWGRSFRHPEKLPTQYSVVSNSLTSRVLDQAAEEGGCQLT
mmetsp:Transcript_80897/g.152919  ORF Transcript_80897/g.152919 Transcript_80897/m.152919 type:complete len:93 (+) Transcript_80897:998-1276(+)